MDVDRSAILLPRLADDETVAASLPQPLTTAHAALAKLAGDAAAKATALTNDARWSESERQNQLSALCNETVAQLAPMAEVAASIEALAAEAEAGALRTSIAKFDPARLLAIQQSLSTRTREQRLSAVMRARAGDLESCAAIVSAPRELSILDGIDERVADGLRDRLLDDGVRTTCGNTHFAVTRFRVGLEASISKLRRLTNTPPPMGERVVRATA